ncbi:MAG: hypothetical protein V4722_00395 [Bacteroidota bacterium]
MKKVFTSIFFLSIVSIHAIAQVPQKISYQGIIRNAANALVANATVGMRLSIVQTTANGTAVYVETQTPATNANGLVSIEIGGGSIVSGTMAGINWNAGPYFIKTETDPAGGTNYSITGISQLLSVPFALAASPIGPAGGDLGGTYPNPKVTRLNTVTLPAMPPGQADYGKTLRYNYTGSNQWEYKSPVEVGESISPGFVNVTGQGFDAGRVTRAGDIANMIPVGYGTYNALTNTFAGKTNSLTFTKNGVGEYQIELSNVWYSSNTTLNPVVLCTLKGFGMISYQYFPTTNIIEIYTKSSLGTPTDFGFSVVVFNR